MNDELIKGAMIIIPEIVDYEIRRSFTLAGASKSIERLDALYKATIRYLPITTTAMRKAADFWADARRRGKPTAGKKDVDADVILAAQGWVFCFDADDWQILTSNVRHISQYVKHRARSRQAVVDEWLIAQGRGP